MRRPALVCLQKEESFRRSIAWSAERPSSVFPTSENAVKAKFTPARKSASRRSDRPGPPEGGARIERYYAIDKRAEWRRRRVFGVGQRVSLENNPMDETLCIWHIAAGKIRAWTSAEPRSYRARTTGEGRAGCDGRTGAAREKTREGSQRMKPAP